MSSTVLEADLTDDLLVAYERAAVVGLDTETTGLDWRVDQLQLCQLFAPEVGTVLVRMQGGTADRLRRFLGAPGPLKVLHFAPFDLRFLQSRLSVTVENIVCTKAASKFLDPGLKHSEHSLQPTLKRWLGAAISKGAVRTSDWGSETLSSTQVDYASADVEYLPSLFEAMRQALQDRGLMPAYLRCCAYMPLAAELETSGVPDPLSY